jgi:hypothetical protein
MVEPGLNLGGWIFLVVAWIAIVSATIFCFRRVMSTHSKK